METEKKHPSPPYVPYKTFKNFLEKFKQGTPTRIDRDLMGTMSGAAQSQLITALRYLRFVSENNLPLDYMKRYVVADGEDRKAILREVLKTCYPFLFNEHFDLANATSSLLRETIESNTSATGETVNRCIAFLKDAAQDAGLKVSQYIMQKRPRNGVPRKRGIPARKAPDIAPRVPTSPIPSHMPSSIEAQNSMLLWGLFQRLPKPGSVWPRELRDQWTQTLNNVLALEYKDE